MLNTSIAPLSDSTSLTSEDFLFGDIFDFELFCEKNYNIREEIVPSNIVLESLAQSSCTFDCFDHVSLPVLADLVKDAVSNFWRSTEV